MPGKRKRGKRVPFMPSLTQEAFSELIAFVANIRMHFMNGRAMARERHRIQPSDGTQTEVAYYQYAVRAMDYVTSQLEHEYERHLRDAELRSAKRK